MAASPNFLSILKVLSRYEVDFMIVGGVAAVLEGAPISTFDLDVMCRRNEKNNHRLLGALEELNARYQDPAGRHLVPDAVKIKDFRFHRLVTDEGPLDILTEIDPGLKYEELVDDTVQHSVSGMTVRALSLQRVIESKKSANRDKDRAVLPVLQRTLQLKEPDPTP